MGAEITSTHITALLAGIRVALKDGVPPFSIFV
jgi:hypothetical protein